MAKQVVCGLPLSEKRGKLSAFHSQMRSGFQKRKPTIFTVRGKCRLKDGKIHTDTESKIITVLLYMNPAWENQEGKLRILRSRTNIDDVAAEISPVVGSAERGTWRSEFHSSERISAREH